MINNKTEATMYDFKRLCNFYDSCNNCPLGVFIDESSCPHFNKIKEVNDIILKWVKTHPKKTKETDFLEKFPNSNPIEICPKTMGDTNECLPMSCEDCKVKYWTEEI